VRGFDVVFTTITVTFLACSFLMVVVIIVGHYLGRSSKIGMLEAIVISLVVIPVAAVIISAPLYSLVTLNDWPNTVFVLPPQFAIWLAAVFGAFLGFRSGTVWSRTESGCIYCLFSVALVLAGLSLVVVLFL